MPTDPICVYCEQPKSRHTPRPDLEGDWCACACGRLVSPAHFREPGPTTTCGRCGHKQPIPHEFARHLGGATTPAPFPEDADA